MTGILQAVEHRLDEWQGPAISGLLWALATMGHDPGGPWVSAVLARSEACIRSFGTGTSLASLLWALATLRRAPSASFMTHFLWQVQRRLHVCNSHALSNIAWALAVLQYKPSPAWVAAFLRIAGKQLGQGQGGSQAELSSNSSGGSTASASGASQLAAAAAAFGSAPSVAGPTSLLSSIPPPPRVGSGASMSGGSKGLVTGLGHLSGSNNHSSSAGQQGSSWDAGGSARQPGGGAAAAAAAAALAGEQEAPDTAKPQAYANLLWGLAKLGQRPKAPWLRQLCSAMAPSLASFTPRDLAHTVWALQHMRFLPDHDWMLDVHVLLRARLTHFDTPSLVMVLVALGGYSSVYRVSKRDTRISRVALWESSMCLGSHHVGKQVVRCATERATKREQWLAVAQT
jgi:hypothetical protein